MTNSRRDPPLLHTREDKVSVSNRELINKATITTEQMANAGLLNPEQANRFVDFVEDESSMADKIRVERFNAGQRLIEKLDVAGRVAVPAAEAADPRVRRGVSTDKVVLEHHDIMVPFEISDVTKLKNIEGEDIEDTVMRLMAKQLQNNMEQAHWDANKVGPAELESELFEGGNSSLYVKDSYMSLFDGWLKLAEAAHVVDAAGDTIKKSILSRGIKALPTKYRKDKSQLRWLLSSDHEQDYREFYGERATTKGDDVVQQDIEIPSFAIKMMPVPLLEPEPKYVENSTANTNGTTPSQLSFGPISNVIILPTTLGKSPTQAYVLGVDYTVDAPNGTWTRLGAGAIPSGGDVKVTYDTEGRILLTRLKNMIMAIGIDSISIERQRNIFRKVSEFAISAQIFCTFEELDGVVLIKNVGVND